MTRINLIDPTLLNVGALVAEYKELPRVFGYVKKAIEQGKTPADYQYAGFRLGGGHMKQFYPRLKWLVERQKTVVAECLRRGYKIQHTEPETLLEGIPDVWINDWTETPEDIKLSLERIESRGGLL